MTAVTGEYRSNRAARQPCPVLADAPLLTTGLAAQERAESPGTAAMEVLPTTRKSDVSQRYSRRSQRHIFALHDRETLTRQGRLLCGTLIAQSSSWAWFATTDEHIEINPRWRSDHAVHPWMVPWCPFDRAGVAVSAFPLMHPMPTGPDYRCLANLRSCSSALRMVKRAGARYSARVQVVNESRFSL